MGDITQRHERKELVKVMVLELGESDDFGMGVFPSFGEGHQMRSKHDLKRKVCSEINSIEEKAFELLVWPVSKYMFKVIVVKVRAYRGR